MAPGRTNLSSLRSKGASDPDLVLRDLVEIYCRPRVGQAGLSIVRDSDWRAKSALCAIRSIFVSSFSKNKIVVRVATETSTVVDPSAPSVHLLAHCICPTCPSPAKEAWSRSEPR